jgi:hypothetical protein
MHLGHAPARSARLRQPGSRWFSGRSTTNVLLPADRRCDRNREIALLTPPEVQNWRASEFGLDQSKPRTAPSCETRHVHPSTICSLRSHLVSGWTASGERHGFATPAGTSPVHPASLRSLRRASARQASQYDTKAVSPLHARVRRRTSHSRSYPVVVTASGLPATVQKSVSIEVGLNSRSSAAKCLLSATSKSVCEDEGSRSARRRITASV